MSADDGPVDKPPSRAILSQRFEHARPSAGGDIGKWTVFDFQFAFFSLLFFFSSSSVLCQDEAKLKPGHFSGCLTTEVQIEVLIAMFGPFDGGRMGRRRKLVLIVVCRRSHIPVDVRMTGLLAFLELRE